MVITKNIVVILLAQLIAFAYCQGPPKFDSDECGIQYNSNRIIGGTKAEAAEFPWMGLVAYEKGGSVFIGCGATLINHRYVLTAGHCAKGKAVSKLGSIIAVRLGEYDLGGTSTPPPDDYYSESVTVHPDYKPDTADRHHDIALIRLNTTVKYTKFVRPICLPTKTFKQSLISTGQQLTVCGWGKTEKKEELGGIKLKATVPIVDFAKCKAIYAKNGVSVIDSQICAGGGITDTCTGDSGGPLMVADNTNPANVLWYAVGLVSYGPSTCATKGVPSIYTLTSAHLDWINSVLKP